MKSFREFINEDSIYENKQCFYFSEVQYKNSYREAEKLNAKDLASAKKEAKKNQAFYGTYLYIGTEIDNKGFIEDPIAYYDAQKKKWININENSELNEGKNYHSQIFKKLKSVCKDTKALQLFNKLDDYDDADSIKDCIQSYLYALEDADYLRKLGSNQKTVETLYDALEKLSSNLHESLNEAVNKARTNNKGTLEIEKILNPYGISVYSAESYGKDIFISINDPEGNECGANLVYETKEGCFGVSVGGTTYSLVDLNKLSKALALRVELCKKLDALMKKLKPEDFQI